MTKNQIEEWREMLIDLRPWEREKERIEAINALCDMALERDIHYHERGLLAEAYSEKDTNWRACRKDRDALLTALRNGLDTSIRVNGSIPAQSGAYDSYGRAIGAWQEQARALLAKHSPEATK